MALRPLTLPERQDAFGRFRWTFTPQSANPEHITIEDAWCRGNLERVAIPQLNSGHGPRAALVTLHSKAAQRFLDFFAELAKRGLMDSVRTFDGSWAPRFVRQSGTPEQRAAHCLTLVGQPNAEAHLSNHAWGTAVDLNAALWPLGRDCPESSPWRRVASAANACGLWWGGDYTGRKDPMHFEVGHCE